MLWVAAALLSLAVVPTVAHADLINTRPVPVGPSSNPSETTLQQFFDNQTGSSINVATDQMGFALYQPTSNNVSTVTLHLEEAGFESTFGLYQLGDQSFRIPVLGSAAEPGSPGWFSNIVFNAGGVADRVVVNRFDSGGGFQSTSTVEPAHPADLLQRGQPKPRRPEGALPVLPGERDRSGRLLPGLGGQLQFQP
jgi:hypothetical protein